MAAGDKPVARYDEATGTLCLKSDTKPVCVRLSHDSPKPVFLDTRLAGRPRGAVFYSRAYYRAHNQKNAGVILLWENLSSGRLFGQTPDPERRWLKGRAPAGVAAQDRMFAHTYTLIEMRNRPGPGMAYCTGYDGVAMMASVLSRQCYVNCWGRAYILQDYLFGRVPARVVWLVPPQLRHKNGVVLQQSEEHATVELHDGDWYVADPSFGFAYVVRDGRRLDVEGLIASLAENPSGDNLLFAAVHDGELRMVPGKAFVRHNPTLLALNYTADKRLNRRPPQPVEDR